MDFDSTAIGIVLALLTAGSLALIGGVRQQRFRTGPVAAVFLAVMFLPKGFLLLRAALLNDKDKLPADWRTYLAASVVVALGLTVEGTIKAVRTVSAQPAKLPTTSAAPVDDGQAAIDE